MFGWMCRPTIKKVLETALYETQITLMAEAAKLDQARSVVGHHEARCSAIQQRLRRIKNDLDVETGAAAAREEEYKASQLRTRGIE